MVYILLGAGFEETEAVVPADILLRGGVQVSFAAVGNEKTVTGAHKIALLADITAADVCPLKGDAFVVPGGMGGVASIKADGKAMTLLKNAHELGCCMTAICAGPSVYAELGITDGKTITCYPGCEDMMGSAVCRTSYPTFIDGALITGRAPGSAMEFGLALLAHLAGADAAESVRRALVY